MSDTETHEHTEKPKKQHSKLFYAGVSAGILGGVFVVIALLCHLVFFPQSVLSDGNRQETGMNTAATAAFGEMHTCEVNTARVAQVAGAQTDAVDRVLKDAISGRYGTGAGLDQNKVFSLLQEAYPDLGKLNDTFANAMAVMTGCQSNFLAKENYMNKLANEFVAWQTGSWFSRTYGGDQFPNDNLKIVIGTTVHTGADALQIMQRTVLSSDNVNAIETGIDNGGSKNPFQTPAPTPSK
jgi:hypothetical protein